MKERKKVTILRSQSGMTLMEIMVSTGLVGIIFTVLMFLLGQVGDKAGDSSGMLKTIEAVAESVSILNAVIPQTTRIKECRCRSGTSSRASCLWDSSGTNVWFDPVRNGSAASPVDILVGEFEAHDGTQALTDMNGLLYQATYGNTACIAQESTLLTTSQRGCRQVFKLTYTAPTAATASESLSGQLELNVGGGTKRVYIGAATAKGQDGLGLTELSCGFDNVNGAGGTTGANFVLNMRVKAKKNIIPTTSHKDYESWYPGDRSQASQTVLATRNYLRGQFREIRLKFGMRNITTRGIYAWRAQSIKSCKPNGRASTNPNECCSQASNGATCVACVAGGLAPPAASACCSGQMDGALCE